MKTLTNNDLIQAAASLRCEVAAVRAVDEVESNGLGFRSDGSIVIRFETHIFKRYTGQTVTGSGQTAYNQAFGINPKAAMLSTSWGRYQIMGFNHVVCGYSTVDAFVAAMKTGEAAQLRAFVAFVKGNGIDDELREKKWAAFAYRYNGSGYRANRYDEKLAAAYARYSQQVMTDDDSPVIVKKK